MINHQQTINSLPNTENKRKLKRNEVKRTIFIVSMLTLPVLQFLVFFVYVNFNTLLMSFQERHIGSIEWGLGNYERFFTELPLGRIGKAVTNSLLFGANDLLLLLLSVTFSFFFYKKVRGSGIFRIIFFLPSIISIVIYVMVYKYMFDPDLGSVVNRILAFFGNDNPPEWLSSTFSGQTYWIMGYCLWVGTGYNILIMGGAMGNLPEDVMEYSRLEGVNYANELFRVVIPMIWPTISVGILGSFTTMFTLFIQVDLLTGGGALSQSTTIAYMINGIVRGGTDLEWAATLGICFTIVATPIIIIVRKILDKVSDYFGI